MLTEIEVGHTKVRCKQPLVDVPESTNEGVGSSSNLIEGDPTDAVVETTGTWSAQPDSSGMEW